MQGLQILQRTSKEPQLRLKKVIRTNPKMFGELMGTVKKVSEPAAVLANLLWSFWSGWQSSVVSTQAELQEQCQLYLLTYFSNIPDGLLLDAIKRIPELAEYDLTELRSQYIGKWVKSAVKAELGGLELNLAVERAKRKLAAGESIEGFHPAVIERARQ